MDRFLTVLKLLEKKIIFHPFLLLHHLVMLFLLVMNYLFSLYKTDGSILETCLEYKVLLVLLVILVTLVIKVTLDTLDTLVLLVLVDQLDILVNEAFQVLNTQTLVLL